MSADTTVAVRYAKALYEVAREQGQVARVEEDLRAVLALLEQNADLRKVLHHPNISASAKIDLLKVLEGKVTEAVFNTLCLLVVRRRQDTLQALLDSFVRIANEALGQATAIVSSPLPLTEPEANEIAEKFSKMTGKKISVKNVIDPKLLGGIQVRIGDRLYDGSLSGKLDRLQKKLQVSQAR